MEEGSALPAAGVAALRHLPREPVLYRNTNPDRSEAGTRTSMEAASLTCRQGCPWLDPRLCESRECGAEMGRPTSHKIVGRIEYCEFGHSGDPFPLELRCLRLNDVTLQVGELVVQGVKPKG